MLYHRSITFDKKMLKMNGSDLKVETKKKKYDAKIGISNNIN